MRKGLESSWSELEIAIKVYSYDFSNEELKLRHLAAEALVDSIDLFLYDLKEQKHFINNYDTFNELLLKMIKTLTGFSRRNASQAMFEKNFNHEVKLIRSLVAKELHERNEVSLISK
ncbi:hypothetical protein [Bacillus sp. Marseille-P3800]|uniref:hypothetical protein n=1 Tax=Bacillus sp. Marseille-P3800 TaxID=2014782 RepID=UPI000C0879E9|nr:hypothetical protein [Bacillus sp. Marseille-P3800]